MVSSIWRGKTKEITYDTVSKNANDFRLEVKTSKPMLDTQLLNEQWWSSINAFQRVFIFIPKLVRWHIFRKFYYPPRVMTVDPPGSDSSTIELVDELLIGSTRETWNDKILILKGHLGGDQAGEVMSSRWHEYVYIKSRKTWLVSTPSKSALEINGNFQKCL